MKQVRIISAPISTRYWSENDVVSLDEDNNKIRLGGCWFDFDDRYEITSVKSPEDYMAEVKAASDAEWQARGFTLPPPEFSLMKGSKYIRLVVTSTGSRAVHCFLDYKGNIYKSASWKVPAKGIRGHIDNDKKPLLGRDYYYY